MPLILAENEATESGLMYDDRTGVSYQYPARYRNLIRCGERFIYYRGRLGQDGRRLPQVYFGSGIVGWIRPDSSSPGRFICQVLDYAPFPKPVPFRTTNGDYLEVCGKRRGYFQPGVRAISESEFESILRAAASSSTQSSVQLEQVAGDEGMEEAAFKAVVHDLEKRFPNRCFARQLRGNPGFDLLVECAGDGPSIRYVRIRAARRARPLALVSQGDVEFSRLNAESYALAIAYVDRKSRPHKVRVAWHSGALENSAAASVRPAYSYVELPTVPEDQ